MSDNGAAAAVSLRELRLANGWTQAELARRSRVCSRTICSIESTGTKPRAPTRRKLLQALGVPFDDQALVFGELR